MSVAYQDVLDATKSVQLCHVQGTEVVACFLVTTDGRVVLGVSGDGGDITTNAARAREAANHELAQQLEHRAGGTGTPPVAEGAAP